MFMSFILFHSLQDPLRRFITLGSDPIQSGGILVPQWSRETGFTNRWTGWYKVTNLSSNMVIALFEATLAAWTYRVVMFVWWVFATLKYHLYTTYLANAWRIPMKYGNNNHDCAGIMYKNDNDDLPFYVVPHIRSVFKLPFHYWLHSIL